MKYHHLSARERDHIEKLSALGYSSRAIARLLGRHHSTINRELQRNKEQGKDYKAEEAHSAYKARRKKSIQDQGE